MPSQMCRPTPFNALGMSLSMYLFILLLLLTSESTRSDSGEVSVDGQSFVFNTCSCGRAADNDIIGGKSSASSTPDARPKREAKEVDVGLNLGVVMADASQDYQVKDFESQIQILVNGIRQTVHPIPVSAKTIASAQPAAPKVALSAKAQRSLIEKAGRDGDYSKPSSQVHETSSSSGVSPESDDVVTALHDVFSQDGEVDDKTKASGPDSSQNKSNLSEAELGDLPWQLRVESSLEKDENNNNNKTKWCGASLVNRLFVLTDKQCLGEISCSTSELRKVLTVVANQVDRCAQTAIDVTLRLGVEDVISHPDLPVSAIRVLEPLPLSSPLVTAASATAVSTVAAVCLPAAGTWDDRIEKGGLFKVSGWGLSNASLPSSSSPSSSSSSTPGSTPSGSTSSCTLMFTSLQAMPRTDPKCMALLGNSRSAEDFMCLSSPSSSICALESGSAVTGTKGNASYIVGVVGSSPHEPCPSRFLVTRLTTKLLRWLLPTVASGECARLETDRQLINTAKKRDDLSAGGFLLHNSVVAGR